MKNSFLVLTALILVACFTPAFANASEFSYNGHVYTNVYGNWFDAEASAVAWGGHLVTINDAPEEAWLQSTFGSRNWFWIGLTDKDQEGTWNWISGEPVTYTHWANGQPDNGGWLQCFLNEDYAVMNWGCGDKWNDLPYWGNCKGIAEKVVPEPISAGLFLLGGGALAIIRRKQTAA